MRSNWLGGVDKNAVVFNRASESVVAILKGHTKKVFVHFHLHSSFHYQNDVIVLLKLNFISLKSLSFVGHEFEITFLQSTSKSHLIHLIFQYQLPSLPWPHNQWVNDDYRWQTWSTTQAKRQSWQHPWTRPWECGQCRTMHLVPTSSSLTQLLCQVSFVCAHFFEGFILSSVRLCRVLIRYNSVEWNVWFLSYLKIT